MTENWKIIDRFFLPVVPLEPGGAPQQRCRNDDVNRRQCDAEGEPIELEDPPIRDDDTDGTHQVQARRGQRRCILSPTTRHLPKCCVCV